MSHQPSRTRDVAEEWPEERKKKSSKTKAPSTPSSQKDMAEDDSNEDVDMLDVPEWDTKTCLFCPSQFSSFNLTLSHMTSTHNLTIPEEDRLVVDVETLLTYCHVVIHGYLECPMCGTQRQTLKPLQAHMRDKYHCSFSISDPNSDFRAFYEDEHGEEGEREITRGKAGTEELEEVENGQVRLSSGRVVGSKMYRAPRTVKETKEMEVEMLQDSPNPPSSSSQLPTSSTSSTTSAPQTTALSRAERRGAVASTQLSRLSRADQLQLAHLPAAQQRAVLSTQKKQVAKERRAQQWMDGRLRGKGNKFLQANYRADGPGRANG